MDLFLTGQKLIITIVKKGKGKKITEAAKVAGARGGTILYGSGFSHGDKEQFLGIPLEREREIILTLVESDISKNVLDQIIHRADMHKPKNGIAFVIDVLKSTGISNMNATERSKIGPEANSGDHIMDNQVNQYQLIVTIVNRGDSEKVIHASKKAGAEGGTILCGRGTGIHERAKLFNILIEPEKDLVLTLIRKETTEQVLKAIEDAGELKKAGKGIAFVLDVEKTAGINHAVNILNK